MLGKNNRKTRCKHCGRFIGEWEYSMDAALERRVPATTDARHPSVHSDYYHKTCWEDAIKIIPSGAHLSQLKGQIVDANLIWKKMKEKYNSASFVGMGKDE